MLQFEGRVAVVTGGASGIGRGLVERFLDEGMKVVIGDVEEAALDAAVAALESRGEVVGMKVDVTDPEAVDHLAAETLSAFGGWDVVCLNAGVGSGGPAWEQTLADWEWVLGVNLWGVIHGVRSFVPRLVSQNSGHVVITASLAGHLAQPSTAPYNASKFAAVAIGETLHVELAVAAPEVGISILCPGWVNTRIYESGRNRPTHLAVGDEPDPDSRAQIEAFFASAMDPSEVAERVVEGIRERRLHVFTHDFSADAIRDRMSRILAD